MVDSQQINVLFIIEGAHTEKVFYKKYAKLFRKNNFLLLPFCNDIYEIYKEFEKLDFDTTTMEVLKNSPSISEKNKALLAQYNYKFPYIYLCFDFEIQNEKDETKYEDCFEKIDKMLEVFNDDSTNGQLFINYPMFEAIRDFENNKEFLYKKVPCEREELLNYKTEVGKLNNLILTKLTKRDVNDIAKLNLKKANYIVNKKCEMPKSQQVSKIIGNKLIHKAQKELFLKSKKIYVLNTSIFIHGIFFNNIFKSKN